MWKAKVIDMTGKDIPMITCYRLTDHGTETFKRPYYTIKSAEEEKAHQKKLGNSLGFYYGIGCKKCCGVYPLFLNTLDFADLGYYVCLVCGKEGAHEVMEHLARKAWNEGRYHWQPEYRQMDIFDFLKME